jgi:hypothetical protein
MAQWSALAAHLHHHRGTTTCAIDPGLTVMQLIQIFFQPRIVNTLDELPAPEEMLCVHPETTLREWVWIHERLFRYDDELDPEP